MIFKKKSSTLRFFQYALLCYLIIAVIVSTTYFLFVHQREKRHLDEALQQIETSHIPNLVSRLWVTDQPGSQDELEAMVLFPYIDRAEVVLEDQTLIAGEIRPLKLQTLSTDLSYTYQEQSVPLGRLHLGLNTRQLHLDALQDTVKILILQSALALVMAGAMAVIFHRLIGKHLSMLARFIKNDDLQQAHRPFVLTRNPKLDDELTMLVGHFNALRSKITSHMGQMAAANNQLTAANSELRQQEEQFRLLAQNAPEAIFILTREKFAFVNAAALELFGARSADQLLGKPLLERTHPDFREGISKRIHILTREGRNTPRMEQKYLRLDGSFVFVETSGVPFSFQGQQGALIFARDISARKQAEKEQLQITAKLQNLFENSPDAIAILDREDRILEVNKAFTDLFDYTNEQARGLPINDLIAPGDEFPDALEASRQVFDAEHRVQSEGLRCRRDGSMVDVAVIGYPIVVQDELVGAYAIYRDIGIRKQAEQSLIKSKEAAESASRAKSEFLANMSHELRTPLNGVMGTMQLLQSTALTPEQDQYVHLGIKSIKRLTRLLSDILDLSKVEAGRMEIVNEKFSHRALLESVSELFAPTAEEKGVHLICAADPAMPQTLVGDEARLRQILFNLTGNALKFTDTGTVRVKMDLLSPTHPDRARILLSVSDTGLGIAENKIQSLFQPFVQIDGSYTRSHQGAGLGLAIVRRLVELMDGHIGIESEPGRGTTVHIALNLQKPEQNTLKNKGPADPEGFGPLPGLRVLLAEDEAVNALCTKKLLEKKGHQVTWAENGQKALDLLTEHDFDCILMDIQMPVVDGIKATKIIRTSKDLGPKTRIPIIALTAHAMQGDREEFLAADMDGYLAKPVDTRELEDILARLVAAGSPRN